MNDAPSELDRAVVRPGPSGPPTWRDAGSVRTLLETLWRSPVTRLLVFVAVGLLLLRAGLWATHALASVIITVLAAYAVAFLVNPVLVWLERHHIGRAVGVMLLLLVLIGLITVLVLALSTQISGMISGLPLLAKNLKSIVASVLDRVDLIPGTSGLKASLTHYIDTQTANLTTNTGPLVERLLHSGPDVLGTLSSLVGWLGQVGFIVTLAMYFMFEYHTFGSGLLRLFPRRWQPTLYQLSEDVSDSFGMYLRGSILITLACSLLATAGLLILHVPNALALGLLSGLLNLLPYIGIVAASILPMLQAIPQGTSTLVEVAVLYFLINQILGNIIGPIIMGRSARIGPSGILIALLVGLALGGVVGALLAIPFAILIKRWTERYWLTSPLYRGAVGLAAHREE